MTFWRRCGEAVWKWSRAGVGAWEGWRDWGWEHVAYTKTMKRSTAMECHACSPGDAIAGFAGARRAFVGSCGEVALGVHSRRHPIGMTLRGYSRVASRLVSPRGGWRFSGERSGGLRHRLHLFRPFGPGARHRVLRAMWGLALKHFTAMERQACSTGDAIAGFARRQRGGFSWMGVGRFALGVHSGRHPFGMTLRGDPRVASRLVSPRWGWRSSWGKGPVAYATGYTCFGPLGLGVGHCVLWAVWGFAVVHVVGVRSRWRRRASRR